MPFFLPGDHGRIFAVHHEPAGEVSQCGHVLVVPSFNEEMNRCRSMVTILAQALARHGVGTLVVDLHGTGESDGEYGDARWGTWIGDIRKGIEWLDSRPGGCISLLGIRTGVPLAVAAMQGYPNPRALIAWQPVVDGKTYFTQFMRMRIAANMDRTDIPRETTEEMRAQLAAGQSIEIAGYEVHPELAAAIEKARLVDLIPPEGVPVAWFEKAVGADNALAPASRKVLEVWGAGGGALAARTFEGPAFWALHDRFIAPDLVQMTSEWVKQLRSQR